MVSDQSESLSSSSLLLMIVIEFLDEMSNRDGCWNEIETFMNSTESNGADLLLLMGTVSNGENRGFGWWAGPKENRFHKDGRKN